MSQYTCSLCDDPSDPVVQLHTNLTNGATAAIGANCLPVGLVGALAVELGTDPQRLYDTIRKFADREAKSAAKAEAEAGTPAVAGEADPASRPKPDDWVCLVCGDDTDDHFQGLTPHREDVTA